jgi:uncharacterized protein YfaS (alpha-2-macroglobulin family)
MSTSWASIASRSWVSLLLFAASAVSAQEMWFSVSNEGLTLPGEVPAIHVSARNVREVRVRVYRIPDPGAFFRAQPNPRSPRPVAMAGAAPGAASLADSVREAGRVAAERYRDLARAVLSEDLRRGVASSLDISSATTEKPSQTSATRADVEPPRLPGYTLVRELTHTLQARKEDWWRSESVPLFEQGPEIGAYLAEVVAGRQRAYTVALVTDLRFAAKQGPGRDERMFVYVAEARTGKPVAGASAFSLKTSESDAPAAEATTDSNGVAWLPRMSGWTSLAVSRGSDFLLGDASFYFESEMWVEEGGGGQPGAPGRAYIYTERPVYRPGHEVFFKAILRAKDRDGRYSPVPGRPVKAACLDPQERKVYEAELAASDLGSVDGSLVLPAEAALGSYTLRLDWGGRSDFGHFRVEEYKKPEFEVKIETDRERYISGDPMEITVQAAYYFGDPVAGGGLEYQVFRADVIRPWWEDYSLKWFFAGEQADTYNDEQVDQGEGALDRDGRFRLRLEAKGGEHDGVYRVVARVTDATNRLISTSRKVPVAAGLFRIEVDSERYAAAAGEALTFSLRTRTAEDAPTPQKLGIKVIRRTWERGKSREESVASSELGTDASGSARYSFTPREPGSYSLVVESRDERGNRLVAASSFWVWSDKPWWYESAEGALILTADKKLYAPTDTAMLLLVSPVENPTVLLTVEGPSLLEHRLLTASGTTLSIPLRLRDAMSPNVYATATVVSGGRFYTQSTLIVIPPKDRFLEVDITTDKATYKPGEKAELRVAVKDERGRPADAEVAIGVVDQAVYAIAPEVVPDIRTFFYGQRPNEVVTNLSTGYSMYSSGRDLASRRRDARELRFADFKSVSETKIRRTFKDTMFWQPAARTGSAGAVRIPVTTPDNLTTWRITVRAADHGTRVGQTTATFVVRKDLMVRLGLPRFFRARDKGRVTATIHNSRDVSTEVKVKMEAQGLDLSSPVEQVLKLDKQSGATLAFDYEAKTPGSARFTVYALAEGISDAEQLEVPVLPHGLEVADATSRLLERSKETARMKAALTSGAPPEGLAASLALAPSLAGPLLKSLDFLVAYPYGCVEQTMSAFLPTVLVSKTLKELGPEAPASTQKLSEIPKMVEKGLGRLYSYQHEDGGWGWWENDKTHPFMTAYALSGLVGAKEAGFAVDQEVIRRGTAAALDQLGAAELDLATRAYVLHALALAGSEDRTMAEKLFARRKELAKDLNPMSRALLALALHRLGSVDPARELVTELLAEAKRTDGFVSWEGTSWHYDWQNDALQTTAIVLKAILRVDPARPEAAAAVRWLMSRRQGAERWRSTLDTAQVVYALVEYMKARREMSADFEVEVVAGGRSVLKRRFGKAELLSEPVSLPIPPEALLGGREIEVRKNGEGNLFATLTASYYTQDERIPPRSGGPLRIDREYHRLELTRQAGGKYGYRRTPLGLEATVKASDLILVILTPSASSDSEYLMIEDMLPSGFEVIEDTRGWRIEGLPFREYEEYGWGEWYTHREVRDNRVVFFSTELDRAWRKTMQYVLRAQTPGDYHVMPARIEMMYYPETRATTAEARIRVQ